MRGDLAQQIAELGGAVGAGAVAPGHNGQQI